MQRLSSTSCFVLAIATPLILWVIVTCLTRGFFFDNDVLNYGSTGITICSGLPFIALLPMKRVVKIFIDIASLGVNLGIIFFVGIFLGCGVFHNCL